MNVRREGNMEAERNQLQVLKCQKKRMQEPAAGLHETPENAGTFPDLVYKHRHHHSIPKHDTDTQGKRQMDWDWWGSLGAWDALLLSWRVGINIRRGQTGSGSRRRIRMCNAAPTPTTPTHTRVPPSGGTLSVHCLTVLTSS